MSYCVNCGVELKDSEKTCPLCDVEVQNPRAPWKEPAERPYPGRLEPVLKRADRRFFATLATLILCIPVAVTLLSDLLTDGMLTWSGYVAGAMALLFVWVILPFYCKRYYLLRLLSIDCLATLAYLKLIEYASRGDWFLPIALPITVAVSVLVLLCALVLRNRKRFSVGVRVACVFFAAGLATVAIDVILAHADDGSWMPRWSFYSVLPCVVLGVVAILMSRHNRLREEIRRRLMY
ncbi:MAG: hypothetical protein GX929_02545 [Clostridiales bacterium]|nr:hypothetical protein [Clostridiales bacterium]